MNQKLYRGQGKMFVAPVVSGVVGASKFVGNVSALAFSPSVNKIEHMESQSGKRAVDATLIVSRKVGFSATMEDFNTDTLAVAFQGVTNTNVGGTVTAETLPAGLVAGDFVHTANTDISALVVKDSAGAPATLTLGTHYAIDSAKHGTVQILDVGTFVQPFKAAYSYGATTGVDVLSGSSKIYEIRFHGLNDADDQKPVLVRARVRLDPGDKLDLIGDQFGSYNVNGDVLFYNGKFADVVYID